MVGGVGDLRAEQPVGVVPCGQLRVVERKWLHELVGKSQVRESTDAITHDQRRASERVCFGRVLTESHLDPGEHALLTVDLPAASSIHPDNPLRLVIAEANGANLVIENVLGR